MERIFLLKRLDCPNCSSKIEKEVGDLENVNSSSVNLMKQTLTIQTETFDNAEYHHCTGNQECVPCTGCIRHSWHVGSCIW